MRAPLIALASAAFVAMASPAFAQPSQDQSNSFKFHQFEPFQSQPQAGQFKSNFGPIPGSDLREDFRKFLREIVLFECRGFPGGGATGGVFPGGGNGGRHFCPPVSGQ